MLCQFTYSDPVTGLTYEVFYDFDIDENKAVVASVLLGGKKVRLTRGLRQRMTQAAFEQWFKEAREDVFRELIDSPVALDFAFCS